VQITRPHQVQNSTHSSAAAKQVGLNLNFGANVPAFNPPKSIGSSPLLRSSSIGSSKVSVKGNFLGFY
jgi:hypothetical protein